MARLPGLDEAPTITAVLGPTNTGKTHRAIERMLQHRSGMIGLPLRLLAREVYERILSRKGAAQTALVTGEEKIVPPGSRYWVCTVEAMPMDRRVAFLAVDEIQLAGNRTRGRVFTERLLHARGLFETMFLGSLTIAGLIEELVPGVVIETAARLSELKHVGSHKLSQLPKRSAVVAFSADNVYELAERLRARRGGAAVVLGALSPRARNAQVAMYQAGEVQYLVATDAIGMGLNLDVDHVAFSAFRKFDGRRHRALTVSGFAQIAGRAGRYRRDGTFGSTRLAGPMESDQAYAIERHTFPAVERLFWRSCDLDLSGGTALLDSLRVRPRSRRLQLDRHGEDQRALEELLRDEEVRRLAVGREAVELLWSVCGVPDYRKTLTGSHVELLRQVYLHLVRDGALPDSWVAGRIERLDRTDGDIDTLMSRIAFVRTWTYLSFRSTWLRDARHWQAKARAVEDRLSDALHARLTDRFVEVRGSVPVGAVSSAVLGDDATIAVDYQGRMAIGGRPVARLVGSQDMFRPHVKLLGLDGVAPKSRQRLRRRLEHRVQAEVDALVGRIRDVPDLGQAGRALLYRLERGLGSVPRDQTRQLERQLSEDERRTLDGLGVQFGASLAWIDSAVTDRAVRWRILLFALHHRVDPMPRLPEFGLETLAVEPSWPHELYVAAGYTVIGTLAVRADLAGV